MSLETMVARVLPPSLQRVPVISAAYNSTRTLVFFGIFSAFAVILALVSNDLEYRLLMLALALLMAAAGLIGRAWTESIPEGRVQFDPEARGLQFSPSRTTLLLIPGLQLAVLLPALVILTFTLVGGEASGSAGAPEFTLLSRFGPYLLGIIALVTIVRTIWTFRNPVGLRLDEQGLFGVRGTTRIDLSWEDLAGVTVRGARSAMLLLVLTSGAVVTIEPRWIGSDPNLLAPIINYYLEHPDDRELLGDPRVAIRRVEDELPKQHS